ncbi:hypothetical protein [Enterobacter sp. ENT03]|uniref:hypothetical protein n=1 Tax=Enterobacter sp. ENT03 TaxID=2854780 RepID=UPI001C47BF64|nr:hypothetical protein [Enterobacter sp. ENT03]MBV7405605.1 hypothetical protein [Enterobacter sp. ENT03]
MSYLILECGSVARGDTNTHSDRDLVCIWSENPPNYIALNEIYGEIMYYSLNTIKKMRQKGSLFLTHLDIDSKYLDGDKKLSSSFRGYRPQKEKILCSLINTAALIKEIIWYPDSLVGKLWLYDVLYVSLRNFTYCKNALNGTYLFGYEDAIERFHATQNHIETMLLIREGKYSYRRKDIKKIEKLTIRNIENACQSILGETVKFTNGGNTKWEQMYRKDYWAERFIERAILNGEYNDPKFIEKIKLHNYNKNCIKSDITKIIKLKISGH